MNLRNYQITVGEVLKNPSAKALVARSFPQALRHPMLGLAYSMPLKNVLNMARGSVPQSQINQLLSELEKL